MPGSSCRHAVACAWIVIAISYRAAHAETLSLPAAVETALREHPELEQAEATYAVATAARGRARSAFMPRVSSSASVRAEYSDPLDITRSTPISWADRTAYDVRFTIDQLLYDGGMTRQRVRGTRALEHQAGAERSATRLDIELRVVRAYLDVLEARELLEISVTAMAMVDEQYQRARALVQATLRPEIDVLSAQSQLAQAKIAQIHDETAVASAQLALRNAVGVQFVETFDVLPVDVASLREEVLPVGNLTPLAIERRGELVALRAAVTASDASLEVAERRTAPIFTLQTGVFASGASDAWRPGAGVFAALSLSMDLFAPGQRYEIREARAQIAGGRADLERAAQSIELAIGQSALAVQTARQTLDVVSTWRAKAQAQIELARTRYNSSVGSFVELNDARGNLVTARRQEVQARYELARNRVQLARELGREPLSLTSHPSSVSPVLPTEALYDSRR